MPSPKKAPLPPRTADDLRGLGRLATDGVVGVAELVEAMHAAITHLPAVIGRPAPVSTTGLTGLVYRGIRGTTRLVGSGVDGALAMLAPLLRAGMPFAQREAVLAALNGVLGDHLQASANPLAIGMQFRCDGVALPATRQSLKKRLPDATGKLLVQVHGLCMNDLQWRHGGHDHGAALQLALGFTPVQLHYNTGRHISSNGSELARRLDALVRAWPVPLDEIVLLCHSMGGLVARSALETAFARQLGWSRVPLRIAFLGTPHHGAPLERAGSWFDMLIGLTPYSAPFQRLGRIRSAGIQDLRHGNLRDADWQHGSEHGLSDQRAPMTLPAGVRAYAIAATTARADATRLRSDGLVPVDSALGKHPDRRLALRIPATRRWIAHGVNHLDLLGDQGVYQRLERWLRR